MQNPSYAEGKVEIRKDLESKLKTIGWELRPCGCNHDRIYNHKGQATHFSYRNGEIRSEDYPGITAPFGGEHKGAWVLNLEKCDIELLGGDDRPSEKFISIIGKTDDHKRPAIFISFYNLDR